MTKVEPNLSQALGGYWVELGVFCLAGQLVALIAGKNWWVSGFFFGYALMTIWTAPQSYDFNTYVVKYAEQVRSTQSVEVLKKAVLNRWVLLSTVTLLVNAPIIYFLHWRKHV